MDEDRLGGADLAGVGVISVGDLLGTGARAIGANFANFTIVAVVVMSPAMLANIGFNEWMQGEMGALQDDPLGAYSSGMAGMSALFSIGVLLLQGAANFLAQAMLMYGTVEFIAGRSASIGDSFSKGLSHAPVVLAIAFLNTLAIGLGTLLCIIPGIIVACTLYAAVPAAVVERLGPIEAMKRSADLTQGHRMTIFMTLLVIGLISFAFTCTFGMVLGGGMLASGDIGDPESFQTMSPGVRVANYAFTWTIQIGQLIVQAAVAAVFYARIRGIRDDVDADAIADVFA